MTTAFRTEDDGQSGAISFNNTDNITLKASGPDLKGIPTAPTASNSTNPTQIATIAYVNNAVTASGISASTTTPKALAGTGSPGTSVQYSRGDHVHPAVPMPAPSNTTPSRINATGTVGTSTLYAREDHTHGNNISASNSVPNADVAGGSVGTSTAQFARGDHAHPISTVLQQRIDALTSRVLALEAYVLAHP